MLFLLTAAFRSLRAGPSPLPSYDGEEKSQNLLAPAWARIGGVRNTDAEAGALVVSIYFEKSLLSHDDPSSAVRFFANLLSAIESRLYAIEADLAVGLKANALHGYLLATT